MFSHCGGGVGGGQDENRLKTCFQNVFHPSDIPHLRWPFPKRRTHKGYFSRPQNTKILASEQS
eukprot:3861878-Amphidinium_carterae.1